MSFVRMLLKTPSQNVLPGISAQDISSHAHVFVSHARKCRFKDLVSAIRQYCQMEEGQRHGGVNGARFWVDILVSPICYLISAVLRPVAEKTTHFLCSVINLQVLDQNDTSEKPPDFFDTVFAECIGAMKGVLAVLTPLKQPNYLERIW
jgi:hypothetical protein